MNVHVTKTVPIEFAWVVEAYRKVRQGGKAVGIDEESWAVFDKNYMNNCYVIWNRLASGSYLPQAVRAVEIPKKDGTKRKLGIPTLRDRIAQAVVKEYMEQRIDHLFHEHSYGYRPMKSAHDALMIIRDNCISKDWVIDMDISKFFDEIDHEVMLKAVTHILPNDKWVLMYVKRWLEMPIKEVDGTITQKSGKGTPQGGVISPILANLYLHYTLDLWLSKHHPSVSFVRYADDVVIHCQTEQEAVSILAAVKVRLSEVKLSIKESKTRIAYCKDYRRTDNHENVKFEFLGFSFQPVAMKSKKPEGGYFSGFGGRISPSNEQKIIATVGELKQFKQTQIELKDIAKTLNSKLRGWINYYGLFSKYTLSRAMLHVNNRILNWLRLKYRLGLKAAQRKFKAIRQKTPNLFYHWEKGFC
jgi:RNA-directed DNA polymerase